MSKLSNLIVRNCIRAPSQISYIIKSVIIPVYNGSAWIDECFQSIVNQTFKDNFQVSVYNDGSQDDSVDLIEKWRKPLLERDIELIISGHDQTPRGVGYAKNRAVEKSSANFLCFLDIDDVMHQDRLQKQYQAAKSQENMIVGSRFHRLPERSTERYTKWANNLSHDKLMIQIYTSHGPTVIMPTWFCSRDVYNFVGGFDEGGQGVPEDLIFFYRHLELGGTVIRIDEDLLMYRYHQASATFSVKEDTIWNTRMEHIQKHVLSKLSLFTIWNAGKQGRKFYRTLSTENQAKVKAFCDVDDKKIKKGFYTYEESQTIPKPKIPIVHYTNATPPMVICIKLDLTEGKFEENLSSMNLQEGTDYFLFS